MILKATLKLLDMSNNKVKKPHWGLFYFMKAFVNDPLKSGDTTFNYFKGRLRRMTGFPKPEEGPPPCLAPSAEEYYARLPSAGW